jgi:vesicle transport through interaction with t-SNAREs protein 1
MNSSLENGYRMVLESEETGKNILSDLFSQRETVERARDRLREANNNLGKSSRVVGAMARRLVQNKIILFGMCVIMFILVVLVIYLVVRRKS